MEIERSENIMVVTHQAVIRCLYAYFMNVPQNRSPWMEIPLHTVIKLTPRAYSTQEERWVHCSQLGASSSSILINLVECRFKADIPAVSTFRAQYTSAKLEGEA